MKMTKAQIAEFLQAARERSEANARKWHATKTTKAKRARRGSPEVA